MRLFLVGLVIAVVMAVEIGHALFRLESLKEEAEVRVFHEVRRRQTATGDFLRGLLRQAREHCAFLSRSTLVGRVLEVQEVDRRQAATADLASYLFSFRYLDGLRILDRDGREAARLERMGQGIAIMPDTRLEMNPDSTVMESSAGLRNGEILVLGPVRDAARVEVTTRDRVVLNHLAGLQHRGEIVGYLVLTTYAEPLLTTVRSLEPIPGSEARLMDSEFRDVLDGVNVADIWGITPGGLNLPEVDGPIQITTDNGHVFALRVSSTPPLVLGVQVDTSDIEEFGGYDPEERGRIVFSTLLVTTLLVVLGVFVMRTVRRAASLEARRSLERAMAAQERLTSIGLLTSGVAHEINNPLEGIGNYLSLIERDLDETDKKRKWLDQVRTGLERIRRIVRDLLEFGRRDVAFVTLELSAVIDRTERLLSYSKDFRGVTVRRVGMENPVLIHGDTGRLEQVFLNLFLNSARVMNGEGTITVTARGFQKGDDRRVEILVEDTGPGIPEENLERIFDPFFTTSEGSGLGLYVVKGIILAHGGTIEARNRQPSGATFCIVLALSAA